MTIRPGLSALVLVVGCVAAAVPAAAQTAPVRSVYERYTEPIQIFKTGLGTFTRPISSTNKEAQAFFDQGFQMMYSFAKPEAVRSFREAWKRDPDCAICYWGEAWAWGSYLNAPMNAEEAPHAYAAAQKALVAEEPRHRQGARADRRDGGALRREVRRRRSGSSRIAPTPRPCRRWRRSIRTISRSPRSMPTRCSCSSRAAGTRDVQRSQRPAAAPGAREHPGARRPPSGRLSPLRARHRVHRGAGPRRSVRRVPGPVDSRRQPHQPHAVAHLERGRPLGRLGARQPRRPGIRI